MGFHGEWSKLNGRPVELLCNGVPQFSEEKAQGNEPVKEGWIDFNRRLEGADGLFCVAVGRIDFAFHPVSLVELIVDAKRLVQIVKGPFELVQMDVEFSSSHQAGGAFRCEPDARVELRQARFHVLHAVQHVNAVFPSRSEGGVCLQGQAPIFKSTLWVALARLVLGARVIRFGCVGSFQDRRFQGVAAGGYGHSRLFRAALTARCQPEAKQNQGPEFESPGCRVVSKESVHAHRFTPLRRPQQVRWLWEPGPSLL